MEDENNVYEKLEGYRLKILDYREEFPADKFFAEPKIEEEKKVKEEIEILASYLNIDEPKLMMQYVPSLSKMNRAERHEIIAPIANKWLKNAGINDELTWDETGKPTLNSDEISISLSHSNSYLFMQYKEEGDAGCDIEKILQRPREQWEQILSLNKANYRTLMSQFEQKDDNKDVAGTRLWSIRESIYKSIGEYDGDIKLEFMQDELAIVSIMHNSHQIKVLSLPIVTERGSDFMLTFICKGDK